MPWRRSRVGSAAGARRREHPAARGGRGESGARPRSVVAGGGAQRRAARRAAVAVPCGVPAHRGQPAGVGRAVDAGGGLGAHRCLAGGAGRVESRARALSRHDPAPAHGRARPAGEPRLRRGPRRPPSMHFGCIWRNAGVSTRSRSSSNPARERSIHAGALASQIVRVSGLSARTGPRAQRVVPPANGPVRGGRRRCRRGRGPCPSCCRWSPCRSGTASRGRGWAPPDLGRG